MIDRLNTLAKQHQQTKSLVDIQTNVFNDEFVKRGDASWASLIADFQHLEADGERLSWLRKTLGCLLKTACFAPNKDSTIGISLDDAAKFINDLTKVSINGSNVSAASMTGKIFVASAKILSSIYKDEERLTELAPKLTGIHAELFKFSWLSSKLSNRSQLQFWRHYLKKSKYEIAKFNLLPENAVGFSELVALYICAYNDVDRMIKIDWYIEEINLVCGKYSLDNTKCLDLFLTISTEYLTENYHFMIQFLSKSGLIRLGDKNDTLLAQIVAFNLSSIPAVELETYANMCAILVKSNLLNVNLVLNNLTPNHDDLEVLIKKKEAEMEEESMKGIDNPLAMAAALTNEEDETKSYRRDRHSKEKDMKDAKDAPNGSSPNVGEPNAQQSLDDPSLLKLTFIKSLLRHGCFRDATNFIRKYPKCILLDNEISTLIGEIVQYMIQPLYQAMVLPFSKKLPTKSKISTENGAAVSSKPRLMLSYTSQEKSCSILWNSQQSFYYKEWADGIETINTIDELFAFSHDLVSIIGPHLALCSQLITQICRIGVTDIQNSTVEKEAVIDKWIDYFRKFLLPIFPLIREDCITPSQLYSLLKLFPFEKRYFLYNEMITKLSQDVLVLRLESSKSEKEIKSTLKALSIDTISKDARRLSSMVSSNPFATLVAVVKQIENYDKISELVVYSSRYFSEFSYDVLQYVLLLRLTERRPSMQDDGINPMFWAQRLAIFIASLAKDCDDMNLSNIITFMIKKMHQGDSISTIILKEMLSRVAGIRDLNEVNIRRVIMLNSGEPVRVEARKLIFDSRDANISRANALTKMFTSKNAISEILIILYNKMIDTNSEEDHHKILSMKSDELNNLLWSFTELIQFSLSHEEYTASVSPFKTLVDSNHMSLSWAFHIWRSTYQQDESADIKTVVDDPSFVKDVSFDAVDFSKLSRSLFINFWKNSLYNILYDKELYEKEISNYQRILTEDNLTPRKKRHTQSKIKQLTQASEEHRVHFNSVNDYLESMKTDWSDLSTSENIKEFLQYCILPRAMFSPSDAVFTTYFIMNYLPTDVVFSAIHEMVLHDTLDLLLFSSTILESGNMGIFFETLLSNIERARTNEELSEEQRSSLFELHSNICYQIINLLCEKNYMSIRNGIEFMKHVSNVFPVVNVHTQLLITVLEQNLESESREDIKLPINALLGHLKARLRKECIPQSAFCALTEEELALKEVHDSEKKEIEEYHKCLENEKKQEEIRKKLEENKLKRDEAKEPTSYEAVQHDTMTQPNELLGDSQQDVYDRLEQWPLMKVLNFMSEVNYCLKKNNISKLSRYVTDPKSQKIINDAVNSDMPLPEYRDTILHTVENFFSKLIMNHHNPDYIYEMKEFKRGCSFLSKGSASTSADMYSDDVPPTRAKRANPTQAKRQDPIFPNAPSKPAGMHRQSDIPVVTVGNSANDRPMAPSHHFTTGNTNSRFSNAIQSDQNSRDLNGPRDNRGALPRGQKRSGPDRSEFESSKKPRNEIGNFKRNAKFSDPPRNGDYRGDRAENYSSTNYRKSKEHYRDKKVAQRDDSRREPPLRNSNDRDTDFQRGGPSDDRSRAGYDRHGSSRGPSGREGRGRDEENRGAVHRGPGGRGYDERTAGPRGQGGRDPAARNKSDRSRNSRNREDDYRYDDRQGTRGGRKEPDSRYGQSGANSSLPSGPRQSNSSNTTSRYQK